MRNASGELPVAPHVVIDTPLNQHRARRQFLIPREEGAKSIADKIERGVNSSTIPVYPWSVVSRLLRILPTGLIARMGTGEGDGG